MNKTMIFFLFITFLVYISFIAGKLLADMETGDESVYPETGQFEYSESPGGSTEPSANIYSSPFTGVDWNKGNDYNHSSYSSTNSKSYSPSGSSHSYSSYIPAEQQHSWGGGGSGNAGVTMQGSSGGSNHDNFGAGDSNPFGGLLAQLSQVAASEGSIGNPTGTFGMRIGPFQDDQAMKLASTDPHTAPLDSGAIAILFLGIGAAMIFMYKKRMQVC